MAKIEPWMWGVISNAVLVRWTLPDPPPDEIADLASLAAIKVLVSSLTDEVSREKLDSVLHDITLDVVKSSAGIREAVEMIRQGGRPA